MKHPITRHVTKHMTQRHNNSGEYIDDNQQQHRLPAAKWTENRRVGTTIRCEDVCVCGEGNIVMQIIWDPLQCCLFVVLTNFHWRTPHDMCLVSYLFVDQPKHRVNRTTLQDGRQAMNVKRKEVGILSLLFALKLFVFITSSKWLSPNICQIKFCVWLGKGGLIEFCCWTFAKWFLSVCSVGRCWVVDGGSVFTDPERHPIALSSFIEIATPGECRMEILLSWPE